MTRVAVILCCLWGAAAAWATDHALLIGVTDYPYLPKRLWLQGPVNDVALMQAVLQERGFLAQNITTLVSRAKPEQAPTRANILQAFERTRAAVQKGDRVFFYLAGHGSQQPQPVEHPGRPTEADGLDEVFLPADVHSWDGIGTQASIANALLDDEIGEWMDSLVDAGATVWGVFDTCHAGGMARGTRSARTRAVNPVELGLPAPRGAMGNKTKSAAIQRTLSPAGRTDGRSLAFAARGHEAAAEEWLPRGASSAQTRKQGVFTYHLAQKLRFGPQNPSELQQSITGLYAVEKRLSPVPQWLNVEKILWP